MKTSMGGFEIVGPVYFVLPIMAVIGYFAAFVLQWAWSELPVKMFGAPSVTLGQVIAAFVLISFVRSMLPRRKP
jgi:hypothetical protein